MIHDFNDKKIISIRGFIDWIKSVYQSNTPADTSAHRAIEKYKVYFRGQSDSSWHLKPAVLRDESVFKQEGNYLKEASRILWNEIFNLHSYLEKMIYFQHYGLPTRLLDVTFNPLIALYMACCEQHDKDGAVYCGFNYYHPLSNEIVAEKTAEACFNFSPEIIEPLRTDPDKRYQLPIFILPPINNPRLEAQSGAFIMFPLFNRNGIYSIEEHDCGDFFSNKRLIIKAKCKKKILLQLNQLGINEGVIYKDVTAKIKSVVSEQIYNDIIQ